MSKGSNRRPKEISDAEFNRKWNAITWTDPHGGARHLEAMRAIEEKYRQIIHPGHEKTENQS